MAHGVCAVHLLCTRHSIETFLEIDMSIKTMATFQITRKATGKRETIE
jgi:hypothetical protein